MEKLQSLPSQRLPEGFLFTKSIIPEHITQFPLQLVSGQLKSNVIVSEGKRKTFNETLFPENMKLASSIMNQIQPQILELPENFPPVTKIVFLDFHGIVNCPKPVPEGEIPDAPETLQHFVLLLNTLIQLRQKGVGVVVLSFVGQITNSHANLLAFCSQPLFQKVFVGMISVFEKIRKRGRSNWGKGKILHLFLKELKLQEKSVFVDDDPENILDASLWLEDMSCCTLIRLADENLTAKAGDGDKTDICLKVNQFTDVIVELMKIAS
ncbi:putative lipase phosphatase protein [Fadolivirus algeromassiliense]|jgi:hypothetical protein|uniref:Lipase phosphatase protein n=1 Tax=Fadolivirus FV1/VV64 TaxID=3070911 RepID=A0A7D3QWA7_9VIRU|nr:putative lipase phosphatase protein [Fadolivirus algeromassiliense]QKF93460.1 putative lipase phosphatase protein [Fadolivirus FV1/VV64]